jgi:N-acyl-D-amino-acid deacylase
MFDVVIRGGTIVDGTREERFVADIAINEDRIVAIGGELGEARLESDASGLIVAPGFIDTHTHSDGWMLRRPSLTSKLAQGFTTEFLMLDGIGYAPVNESTWPEWFFYLRSLNGLRFSDYEGWETFGDFAAALDRQNMQNSAAFLPYANVRSMVAGFGRGTLDDFQRQVVTEHIAYGIEQGALGLSTGLDYIVQCFSDTDELAAVCRALADRDALYVTHIRYKLGMIDGLREAAEICRRSGIRLHVSHLKSPHPDQTDAILSLIDELSRDVDLSFDTYPYQPGSTMLSYLLPYDVWTDGPLAAIDKLRQPAIRRRFAMSLERYRLPLDRLRIAWTQSSDGSAYQGMRADEYIALSGKSATDALLDLLIEERLAVLLVIDEGDDRSIQPFLQHEKFMIGSDGIYFDDSLAHPRQFGSAARILGPAVRDWKLFSLEEAVYKLSAYPAQRFGLVDRGVIREGAHADLAIFDADTIVDNATYDSPQELASGVREVYVNGQLVWPEESADIRGDELPGRFLKFNDPGI